LNKAGNAVKRATPDHVGTSLARLAHIDQNKYLKNSNLKSILAWLPPTGSLQPPSVVLVWRLAERVAETIDGNHGTPLLPTVIAYTGTGLETRPPGK